MFSQTIRIIRMHTGVGGQLVGTAMDRFLCAQAAEEAGKTLDRIIREGKHTEEYSQVQRCALYRERQTALNGTNTHHLF